MTDADLALKAQMRNLSHPLIGSAARFAREPEYIETNRLSKYADVPAEFRAVNSNLLANSWHVDPYKRERSGDGDVLR